MKKIALIVSLITVGLAVGSVVFLVTWDIPAPIAKVEKVIPNDKFRR
jgi:hypothetical protein